MSRSARVGAEQSSAVPPDAISVKLFSSDIKPSIPCAEEQAGRLPNSSENILEQNERFLWNLAVQGDRPR